MQAHPHMPQQDEAEEEYEYEYDETETETFLVDLDLSSLQPNLRSNVPGAPKVVFQTKRRQDAAAPQTPEPAMTPDPTGTPDDRTPSINEPQGTPARDTEEDDQGAVPSMSKVQILGLDTTNPIVSYMDRVYSCMWTDMIGSNMFLAQPGMIDFDDILLSGDDYDLIGTSRIKLVGEPTNLVPKHPPVPDGNGKEDEHGQPVEPQETPEGRSLGDIRHPNAKVNSQIKRQASFLEKLMDLKRQRGEDDIVRVFVDEKSASTGLPVLHDTMHDELQELNRKVVKGDAEALARLQNIYSHQGQEAKETTRKHSDA